ncbi:TetR/AcrR family transcriptional regulator [Actinorugispora endophytica]|uniref:TetR family transcriptional regulator n=1 Tax=Actinorugispora endophytica TaxID=1605990 RepID=A0A4R6V5F1_9ACTN|nr:TetR/AcrR family transcriptional regulator [Actinorugispora endophytica]TDQ54181.1 TetR family transcriptional regulator [Actinorugispora endophytica]
MADDRRQRGYAKGRAKREQILDEAIALFGEVGYRSASLREIAQRCGITHAGLQHHFPTKESLLLEVLKRRDEVDAARSGLGSVTGVELLRRLVELTLRNTEQPGIVELYCVLSSEATAPGHPAHGFFADRYTRTTSLIEEAFAETARSGALRAGVDPRVASQGVVALMDGLQVQWLLNRASVDMAAVLRAHIGEHLTVDF